MQIRVFSTVVALPVALGLGPAGRSGQNTLRRFFPADEAFVGPHVAPISVTSAIGDSELVQVAVNRLERLCALQIEDDIRVAKLHRLSAQNLVVLSKQAAAPEIGDDRLDQVLGPTRKGSI